MARGYDFRRRGAIGGGGEIKPFPPLWGRGLGEGSVHPLPYPFIFMSNPSKDGDGFHMIMLCEKVWIPAFAGKADLGPCVFLVLRQAQHEEGCEA